jgi:hypothetical protein
MTDSRQVSQETVFWCIRRPVLSSETLIPNPATRPERVCA